MRSKILTVDINNLGSAKLKFTPRGQQSPFGWLLVKGVVSAINPAPSLIALAIASVTPRPLYDVIGRYLR
jgi:hypothetical protein